MVVLLHVKTTYLVESEDWRVKKEAGSARLPCRFIHAVLGATLGILF